MSVEFEQLVDKRKAKSDVWKHFGFPADAHGVIMDEKKIVCRLCKTVIAYSGNTSNLTYHLQRTHPRELKELCKDSEVDKACPSSSTVVTKQLTFPGTIVRATPFPRDGTKHKQLVDAVADFLCLGLQPLSVVDDTSFRHLLESAEPRFHLPHRTHFTDSHSSKVPYRSSKHREAADNNREVHHHIGFVDSPVPTACPYFSHSPLC